MTIKEMIQALQKLANDSKYGMDTKILFIDEEWGATDISEMFLNAMDVVIIKGEN